LGVPIVDLAATAHGLSEHATVVVRSVPGEELGAAALAHIAGARGDRPGPVVVVLGRASLADSAALSMRAARTLRDVPGVQFLSALRRGNVHGAIDSGLAPGFFPGRVALDAGRVWFDSVWGSSGPAAKGLDTQGVLEAADAGKIEVLVINGCDPVADFPDGGLARRGIAGAKHVIAIGAFLTGTSKRADVVLPSTLWGEKTGSITNLEGRVQRVGRKVAPEGTAMDDWRIAVELALRLGADFDFATVDEVTDELARVAPAFAGVDCALLRQARDGVVLPLSEHTDELVLRTRGLSILAEDGSGASWDPIKAEGAAATELEGLEELAPDADTAANADAEPEPEAPREPAAVAPALWEWDGTVPDVEVPARDAYALRLVVGRRLYDNGRMVSEAPALVRLRKPFPLRLSPHDAAGLGVESGAQVRVTSGAASRELAVEIDAGVPAGVARLDFSADGKGAAELIDAHAAVTDLRAETLR
jgi:predicted molibdopterin-dependent oxidoreductase YjgC